MTTTSLHKDDLVELFIDPTARYHDHVHGWMPVTEADYASFREECERDGHYGSDGESKLPPQHTSVPLVPGRRYIVVRGRCSVRRGYHTVGGCCQILDPIDGHQLWVERRHVRKV